MSTVGYVERLRREQPVRRGLPDDARILLFATIGAALASAAVASAATAYGSLPWRNFAIVTAGGALAQLFATPVGRNQGFHTGLAFAVAAALLLPPELVVLTVLLQHVPDWLRHGYRWYVQTFNMANYAIAAVAAWAVHYPLGSWHRIDVGSVAVLSAAAATFVLVNHGLVAAMLKAARGRNLKASGVFGLDCLITDAGLAAVGVLVAVLLVRMPALLPLVALPLILVHRALVVPSLREQAFRDHKTGLLNWRGFEEAAVDEFDRARRFGRPLSVLLCDIDDLRGINNRYGHLKGDTALLSLADALRSELRSYDLCARFGGDEFVVLLPEASEEEAHAVAGRIHDWLVKNPMRTSDGPLPVGVSIGAVVTASSDEELHDVIARADAAMYDSKRPDRRTAVATG